MILPLSLSIYAILVLINFLYIKRDFFIPADIDLVVVLSASQDFVTLSRLKHGIQLLKKHPNTPLVVCGKEKANLMKKYLFEQNIKNTIIQDQSTNTYEDAIFLKRILGKKEYKKIILVSSEAHQRRALHSFQNIFNSKIFNSPSLDLFTFYSILLPTGWIINFLNSYKDLKYNGRLI